MRYLLSTVACLLLLCTTTLGAMPLVGPDWTTDGEITLMYGPHNGSMAIEANGQRITTFELKSDSGLLIGTTPDLVQPPFDVHTPVKFFILKTDGIGDTDLGPIAAAGQTAEFLASDLTLSGSVLPNGGLGNPNLCVCIPEPTSITLILLGCMMLLQLRQSKV